MATGTATAPARIEKGESSLQFKTVLTKYFYFTMSLVFTGLVVWGFSRTVNTALFHATPPRPLLLWFHGAAFSAWLLFFTAQSALVRVRKVSVHRTIGWFGVALAASMVVLGTVIAVVMAKFDNFVLHQKDTDAFLSVPFVDMIAFGTCVGLAVYFRKKPELHRRLLFIATCQLMDAAVGRFDYIFNNNLFYPILDLLIIAGMLRDRFIDGRVHKVYWYALPSLAVLQALAIYLWRANPHAWQQITHLILGM